VDDLIWLWRDMNRVTDKKNQPPPFLGHYTAGVIERTGKQTGMHVTKH